MYYLYKQYFYSVLIKELDELIPYVSSDLNRYLLYHDVVDIIDKIFKVGE